MTLYDPLMRHTTCASIASTRERKKNATHFTIPSHNYRTNLTICSDQFVYNNNDMHL